MMLSASFLCFGNKYSVDRARVNKLPIAALAHIGGQTYIVVLAQNYHVKLVFVDDGTKIVNGGVGIGHTPFEDLEIMQDLRWVQFDARINKTRSTIVRKKGTSTNGRTVQMLWILCGNDFQQCFRWVADRTGVFCGGCKLKSAPQNGSED